MAKVRWALPSTASIGRHSFGNALVRMSWVRMTNGVS